jgi:hypothetical protein
MSAGRGSDKSYEPFTDQHLKRLARIAHDDQAAMFTSSLHPDVGVHGDSGTEF